LQVGDEREQPGPAHKACEEREAIASRDEQNVAGGFGGLAQPERVLLNALLETVWGTRAEGERERLEPVRTAREEPESVASGDERKATDGCSPLA
jgi:hypothetical protein